MKCRLCSKKTVIKDPNYCKEHFIEYFENKVKDTIEQHKLIKKEDRVVVAASGGKDSLTVLSILHKFGFNVTALAIDEGISGYRDNTLKTLRNYCEKKEIPLEMVSFEKEFGNPLDNILKENDHRPCTVCGVFRRHLLSTKSSDFDVLATGHNMDDEAQAVLMNLIKGNTTLLKRQGPISGAIKIEKFTKRVKPLYFCKEKDVMVYSFLNNLTTNFKECPNVRHAFRLRVRDMLNDLEERMPGSKENLLKWYVRYKGSLEPKEKTVSLCKKCGQPSTHNICNTCKFVMKIKA